ncbi:hypothetical protein TCAL_02363 [Tigriopus californicus]|uniref:Uncharacterized protein n=1 Tax=Tigriopus californicus TaxID=6832 RepID=A0A553NYJ3_TIGCA|nr:hypothetical protein TCAL_02363 [Tigriopus californicus]|eukprot:TCALIF_02363-PA protein Name:"Similar to slc39a1 Zinc transporter ZIP1 (Danio rerio)" AED:0.20 eAED:0.20 QI:0/1/0.25/1/1/1/4/0/334
MEHLTTVFVTTALAVILSLVFSGIPFLFTKSCLNLNPEHPNHNKLHRNNVILSFLLNLGGGVLIANCFCHWLPEVRAAFGGHGIGDEWPLAEIILCLGFFLVRFLEEVIQSCAQNTPHGHSHRGYPESEQQVRMVNTTSDDLGPRECTPIRPKRSVVSPQSCDPQPVNDILEKQSEHIFVSTIRTVFAIVALSFHSVIEGLALSYESDETGIWMNFGALALHKFVIAFSIGVELMTSQVPRVQSIIYLLMFAFAPALGSLIGVIMAYSGPEDSSIGDFILQVFQGVAIGTVIYVVFFEIFPKAKDIGGSGFQHVGAMMLGFLAFMPSISLRKRA